MTDWQRHGREEEAVRVASLEAARNVGEAGAVVGRGLGHITPLRPARSSFQEAAQPCDGNR